MGMRVMPEAFVLALLNIEIILKKHVPSMQANVFAGR